MFKQFNLHLFGKSCNEDILAKTLVAIEPIRQKLIETAKERAANCSSMKKYKHEKVVKILSNDNSWKAVVEKIVELQGEWLNQSMKDKKEIKLASLGIFHYNDRKHEWQLLNLGHTNKRLLNACWARYNKLRYLHKKLNNLAEVKKVLSREELNEAEKLLRQNELKSYKINPSWKRVQFPLLDETPNNTEVALLDRNPEQTS
jgi:nucleoid DNA-binding protein